MGSVSRVRNGFRLRVCGPDFEEYFVNMLGLRVSDPSDLVYTVYIRLFLLWE